MKKNEKDSNNRLLSKTEDYLQLQFGKKMKTEKELNTTFKQ